MDLKTYLMNMPLSERKTFAIRCGTTYGRLLNLIYGQRRAGESLCINIERESDGVVTCEALRPDVDWHFIRGTAKPERLAA